MLNHFTESTLLEDCDLSVNLGSDEAEMVIVVAVSALGPSAVYAHSIVPRPARKTSAGLYPSHSGSSPTSQSDPPLSPAPETFSPLETKMEISEYYTYFR